MSAGPITYYEHFGKSTVLIASHKIAVDMFERRGHNYSDRSRNVVMGAELYVPFILWFIIIIIIIIFFRPN